MKFKLTRSTDEYGARERTIEIGSIEDLVALARAEKRPLILKVGDLESEIEVYDGYRE